MSGVPTKDVFWNCQFFSVFLAWSSRLFWRSWAQNGPQWQKVLSHFRANVSIFSLFWVPSSIFDGFGVPHGPKIPKDRPISDRVQWNFLIDFSCPRRPKTCKRRCMFSMMLKKKTASPPVPPHQPHHQHLPNKASRVVLTSPWHPILTNPSE